MKSQAQAQDLSSLFANLNSKVDWQLPSVSTAECAPNTASEPDSSSESCASSLKLALTSGTTNHMYLSFTKLSLLSSLFPNDLPSRWSAWPVVPIVYMRHNSTNLADSSHQLSSSSRRSGYNAVLDRTDRHSCSEGSILTLLAAVWSMCTQKCHSRKKNKQVICGVARLLGRFSKVSLETEARVPEDDEDVIVIDRAWNPTEERPKFVLLPHYPELSHHILRNDGRIRYLVDEERRRNPGNSFDTQYTDSFHAAASKTSRQHQLEGDDTFEIALGPLFLVECQTPGAS